MLLDENARGERVAGVIVGDRYGSLHDDGPAVQLPGHEVNRRSAHAHSMVERLPLCINTGEGWEQRWMNVQDRVPVGIEQPRSDEPHEAGEADQRHPSIPQGARQCRIVVLAGSESPVIEDDRLDPCGLRARQAACIRLVGNNDGDGRVEASIRNRVDESLQVAPATGDEDADHSRLHGVLFVPPRSV